MVGIPTSRGCITCKKRRVKCDEAKPACIRCSKAYIPCEGYSGTGHNVFVDQTSHVRQKYDNHITVQSLSVESSRSTLESAGSEVLERVEAWRSTVHHLSPSLSLEAFKDTIFVSYTSTQLFPGTRDFDDNKYSRAWILDAIESDRTPMVYHASCSLSAVFFARVHNKPDMLRLGARYYARSIHLLNQNLRDPRFCRDPSNLAAALVLTAYEAHALRATGGWIQRAGGVAKLIESNGAEAFRSEPARSNLLRSRMLLTIRALRLRQKTFLEEDSWRIIPWVNSPTRGGCCSRLLDVIVEIPSLAETTDRIVNGTDIVSDDRTEHFRSRLVQVMSKLFLWRWRWEKDYPNGATEVPIQPFKGLTIDENGIPLYSTFFYFDDYYTGSLAITMYNTALLFLFDLVKHWDFGFIISEDVIIDALALARIQMDAPPATNPLKMPHKDITIPEITQEICRSIEYALGGSYVNAGRLNFSYPLEIVVRCTQTEKERTWSKKLLEKVIEASSIGSTQHMGSASRGTS